MKIALTSDSFEPAADFALALANTLDPVRNPVNGPTDLLSDARSAEKFLTPYLQDDENWEAARRALPAFRDALRRAMMYAARQEQVPVADADILHATLDHGSWRIAPDETGTLTLALRESISVEARLTAWAAIGFHALLDTTSDRLRLCQSAPCEELFRDRTKPGQQRFCSKRCANRFNVARHRERLGHQRVATGGADNA